MASEPIKISFNVPKGTTKDKLLADLKAQLDDKIRTERIEVYVDIHIQVNEV
jgi:hypothetical protein